MEHICTEATCPNPSQYFVTAIDGTRWHYMAGPYTNHADALADVPKVRDIVNSKDSSGRAWFMSWGTIQMKEHTDRIGQLNKFGLI